MSGHWQRIEAIVKRLRCDHDWEPNGKVAGWPGSADLRCEKCGQESCSIELDWGPY